MSLQSSDQTSQLPSAVDTVPVGEAGFPGKGEYRGQYVTLTPLNPQDDAAELFSCSHGTPEKEKIWTYMRIGPFAAIESMGAWLETVAGSDDPLFFTVSVRPSGRRIGMVSFMSIVPEMRRLELGHIWYAPEYQRTQVNTEAVYLMLRETFDRLRYRRVEWKCDALNERSRSAAVRLGFTFEGVFRQHMIVKGKNRDTAWYSLLDREWAAVRRNMEEWLYENPDGSVSLRRLRGLR
jgi:RimJ/RimL family protein N-acetyltransferase